MITDGNHNSRRRATLAAVRAVAAAGYRPAVTVSGRSLAAASRWCLRRIPAPPVTDPGYKDAVLAELDAGHYLMVLPATDASLVALGLPGVEFLDKRSLRAPAVDAGLRMPPEREFPSRDELMDAASELSYPVVVKPILHRFFPIIARESGELNRVPRQDGPLLVQPYIDGLLHEVSGTMWKGKLIAAVHCRYLRTWPLDCGTVTAAVTEPPRKDLENSLARLLRSFDGVFQAQFAGRYLIDLNPMVHTTLALGAAAGINTTAILCNLRAGKEQRTASATPRVFFRWLEGDLKSILASLGAGRMSAVEALRALSVHRRAARSMDVFSDPMPSLSRLLLAIERRRRKRL